MSPADELAQYLADEGVGAGVVGGNADWSLHVSREPATPANVITLYDTPGNDPLVPEIRQPTIQVRVRSLDYLTGFAVQDEIHGILAQPDAETGDVPLEREIGAGRYVAINLVGDMMSLGRDDNDRHLVVANYRVIRQPLEGS